MAGRSAASSAGEDVFSTTGPLRTLLREADWATTPLGPVERWPDSLRAAIKTVLPSRVPMMLWWGPQLVQLYNAAAMPVIGRKHPAAIGQRAAECYAEAWSELGPLTDMVMTGQGATFSRDLFVPYERHGYVEETYWTFSCSPVQDGNRIGGLLVAAMDTTRELARIFERFHQVPGVISRGPEGAGIGLSLVSDLVKAHHGTIAADSTVGVGTTFTVRIPMSTASARPRPVGIHRGLTQAFRAEVDAGLRAAGEQPVAEREPARRRSGRCCWSRTTRTCGRT